MEVLQTARGNLVPLLAVKKMDIIFSNLSKDSLGRENEGSSITA
jgi:hypothetical protein